jgi:adenylosuccinate synthase
VNDIPSIKSANDSAKKKIKTVYRGIGIGEDDEGDPSRDQIIAQDRESKYVATSDSRHAAKNFALQKGHLEDSEERRSALGYIIEYRVTPDAILFDTKVIDTVYNESEILIDATKAEVVEIKEV